MIPPEILALLGLPNAAVLPVLELSGPLTGITYLSGDPISV